MWTPSLPLKLWWHHSLLSSSNAGCIVALCRTGIQTEGKQKYSKSLHDTRSFCLKGILTLPVINFVAGCSGNDIIRKRENYLGLSYMVYILSSTADGFFN